MQKLKISSPSGLIHARVCFAVAMFKIRHLLNDMEKVTQIPSLREVNSILSPLLFFWRMLKLSLYIPL